MNIENLKAIHLKHFYWKKAFLELSAEMLAAKPGSVVRVTGASRSGKSDLIREYITQFYPQDPASDHLSAVLLEVHNMAAQGRFRTKSLLRDAIEAVKHPILSSEVTDEESLRAPKFRDLRITESEYMNILIQAFRARKTQVLVLDEPQDIIFSVGGQAAASAILNSWKALASKANLVIVLVGAYPILDVLDLSPHITGRTKTVHLERYKANEHDIPHFISILDALSEYVPVKNPSGALVEWAEELLSGSLGCVGLLLSWITSATSRMQVSGESELSFETLQDTRLPEEDLEVLLNEILPGEARLAKKPESPKPPSNEGRSSKKGSTKNRKPGKQLPRRHKLGNRK